jgi:hypothetical protein
MTLELRPEIVDVLAALASAQGLSVEDYLEVLVNRERLGQPMALMAQTIRPKRMGPEEWAREFQEWADSFSDAPPIPDESLSRENLYPDRR